MDRPRFDPRNNQSGRMPPYMTQGGYNTRSFDDFGVRPSRGQRGRYPPRGGYNNDRRPMNDMYGGGGYGGPPQYEQNYH